jgi:hypothetical protein
LEVLKANRPYAYVAVGVVWLVFAFVTGSFLLLWPVVACVLGGALLRLRPVLKLTWAWTTAAAVMGLLLALYQMYASVPLLFGAFALVAWASLVVFLIFAVGHFLLLYVGSAGPAKKTS